MTTPDPLSAAVEAYAAVRRDPVPALPGSIADQRHRSALSAAITAYIQASGMVLVPKVATPQMIATVAVQVQPPTADDYEAARAALDHLPASDHPDVADVLAELARDYRALLSAAPAVEAG